MIRRCFELAVLTDCRELALPRAHHLFPRAQPAPHGFASLTEMKKASSASATATATTTATTATPGTLATATATTATTVNLRLITDTKTEQADEQNNRRTLALRGSSAQRRQRVSST